MRVKIWMAYILYSLDLESFYVSIGGCACDRSDNLGGKVDVNKVSLVTFAEHDVRFEIRSQKV